jgi:hypothetical protein
MFRIRSLSSLAYVLAGTVLLSACGGGGSHGTLPAPSQGQAQTPAGPVGSATATFRFTFPKATSSSHLRRAKYLSSATASISLQVTDTKSSAAGNADIYANVPAGLKAVQSVNFANLTGTPTTPGQCGTDPLNPGNYECTAQFQLPIGINTITIASWDANGGTGHKLSQQIATVTTLQGVANGPGGSYAISLDANAATITLNGSQPCQNGPVGSVFGSVGTTTVNFGVSFADGASKTIVNPGLPVIAILGNDAAYHTDSGTINATGGTVSFTINQSAQSFTLTPSTVPISGASVTVRGTPPSAGDGLSFNVTHNFTFSAGTAPPTNAFLAAVEQASTSSGQVDFFQIGLGGSGGPDTFTTFATAPTLAVTNSTNENKPDVDNPESLKWDTNGDLLIGNGHDGSVNSGNMACVPVGAIATGANTSTTVSTNVSSPVGMAYDSRDGSVALANEQPGATYNLSQYLLTGNYTAAPAADNIKVNQTNLGSNGGIVNIPTLPAGSYAIALDDGNEVDTASSGGSTGHSEIALINGSTHTVTHMSDPESPPGSGNAAHGFAIDNPWGLGWDAQNSQLVIGNFATFHHNLSFYDTSGNFIKAVNTTHKNNLVAVSPDGHIAVAEIATFLGYPQVQVYLNASGTTAPTPVLAAIPFNGESSGCGGGGTHIYGSDTAVVQSLEWLSNTKLLIGLKSTSAGVYTAQNGLYIFDITASAVPTGTTDTGGCPAFSSAAPKQTGFQHLNQRPFATAYKP